MLNSGPDKQIPRDIGISFKSITALTSKSAEAVKLMGEVIIGGCYVSSMIKNTLTIKMTGHT